MTRRVPWGLLTLLLLTLSLCGCDALKDLSGSKDTTEDDRAKKKKKKKKEKKKSKKKDDEGGDEDDGGTSKPPENPLPTSGSAGLAAPDNDAKVTAKVKAVIKCDFKAYGFSSSDCPAYKDWLQGDVVRGGRADATLVNLAEDGEVKVRYLAVSALSTHGHDYQKDAAMVKRLVAVFSKESNDQVARPLARVLCKAKHDETGTTQSILDAIKASSHEDAKEAYLSSVLVYNTKNTTVRDVVHNTAEKGSTAKLRQASLTGLGYTSYGTPKADREALCTFFRERAEQDSDDAVAEHALDMLFRGFDDICKGEYDAGLKWAEGRVSKGNIVSMDLPGALRSLGQMKHATPAQKSKATELLRTCVGKDTAKDIARSQCLRYYYEFEPAKGVALAKTLVDDKNFTIKYTAKDIVKKGVK